MNWIKLYFIAFVIFFAIDLLWLGVLAKNLYRQEIGHLMTDQIRWGAALFFYALYLFGVLYFGVVPGIEKGSPLIALVSGALFGLLCYATYDLTNLATLKNWPVKIVVYDVIWGTFITGVTSSLTYWIGMKWNLS